MDRKLLIAWLVLITAALAIFFIQVGSQGKESTFPNTNVVQKQNGPDIPLSEPNKRITKKFFGIYITPQTSPVRPERFSGYHTGTDYEILPGEEAKEVPVRAICNGRILESSTISGYGGVIIQECTLRGQPVRVLYGHVNNDNVFVNTRLQKGDFLANLAPANSALSGGERKHLHLGIIKGTRTDYRGYVQSRSELSGWFDYSEL